MRALALRLSAGAVAVLVPITVVEVGVRFLPYHTGLESMPVYDESPLYHFKPNREFTFSQGWDFKIVTHRQTNNYGFVSDIDYDPVAPGPLLAIIGDSYIEAVQFDYADTAQARLLERLRGRGRVYSFGAGSAPLSQYLAWSGFVAKTFRADGLVVNIVGGDFDGSLLSEHGRSNSRTAFPGMHYFSGETREKLRLIRLDLTNDPLREILKKSALASYLVRNVSIQQAPSRLARLFEGPSAGSDKADKPAYVGNVEADAEARRVALSKAAVDLFLERLPETSSLPPERILLTVDGVRPQLYDDQALAGVSGAYFPIMRDYLIVEAKRRGFEVADLQPRFMARYEQTGERFEWPFNNHWNASGHAVFAQSILESKTFSSVFGDSPPSMAPRPPRSSTSRTNLLP